MLRRYWIRFYSSYKKKGRKKPANPLSPGLKTGAMHLASPPG
jgi:hypothetical protein